MRGKFKREWEYGGPYRSSPGSALQVQVSQECGGLSFTANNDHSGFANIYINNHFTFQIGNYRFYKYHRDLPFVRVYGQCGVSFSILPQHLSDSCWGRAIVNRD